MPWLVTLLLSAFALTLNRVELATPFSDTSLVEKGAVWNHNVVNAFDQTICLSVAWALPAGALIWLLCWFRLRQISVRLGRRQAARYEARARIAGELHDALLQDLAGISLQLNGIAKQAATAPEKTIPLIEQVREQVDICFQEARVKVWNFRSSPLERQD